ncbi:MAG: hypothetical protein AB1560_02380 [Pseudomonadota bacterium]
MFRTITWFLIVSLFMLNMAWAIDNCAFSDPSDSGAGMTQPFDPAPEDSTSTLPACGQWCPGWVSLVTLPASPVLLPSLLPTFEGGFGADPYVFLPAPPPIHPPIA